MTRISAASLVTFACVTGFLLAPTETRADAKVYLQTLRSTTWVLAKNSSGTSSGTGVLVDASRKLILTNFHVVGDARVAVVFFPEIQGDKPIVSRQHYLDNVRKLGLRGRVVAADRKRDLALIQLEKLPEGTQALTLAKTSASPGEEVQSVGNAGATEALWVYTSGTVRAVYKKQFRTGAGEHDFTVVETQSPINSGDSGGPVVNNQGELVAISQSIAPNARLISYCVDISEVNEFLGSPWKPAPIPVTELLERAELKYTQHESGHYEVEFEAEENQVQSVFITKDIEYYERADVRKVWSLALMTKEAPNLETALKLLQQSSRTKLGAWTVEQTKEGDYMILYVVKLDATASPDATRSTMEYVAKLTRVMRKDLLPKEKAENASETLDEWLSKK